LTRPNKQGQLRIIGGKWRGRKLSFPGIEGLRPTADRVRETLFNWLQVRGTGGRCLDLFAGSGALGLEALSRGAAEVVMVEQDPRAAQQIRQHLQTLDCQTGRIEGCNAFSYLNGPATAFDVVFLDPPYKLDCLTECCQLLEQNGWLKDKALIYLEHSSKNSPPNLPDNWLLTRSKKAGETGYYLAQRNG